MSHSPVHIPTRTASLVCSGLGFGRPDGRTLFKDLDLVVGPGRTGLVGPNGSGKSTLLRLLAVERGEATEDDFAAVGDDWDVEERARAALDRLGLQAVRLDGTVGEVSGGEAVLLGLAGQLLRKPEVLLLDEPSNNLDLDARERLHELVASWRGALVVVSHDLRFLRGIGITRWLRLDRGTGLSPWQPPQRYDGD